VAVEVELEQVLQAHNLAQLELADQEEEAMVERLAQLNMQDLQLQ